MSVASHDFTAQPLVFQSQRRHDNVHPLRPVQPAPIDPCAHLPDIRLVDQLGAQTCLQHAVLPWQQVGGATVILCADVDLEPDLRGLLEQTFGPIRIGICGRKSLNRALLSLRGRDLAEEAETRVTAQQSCRIWDHRRARRGLWLAALMIGASTLLAPKLMAFGLVGWICLVLALTTTLRLAAGCAVVFQPAAAADRRSAPVLARLPVVSLLVPLYQEREVAEFIVRRIDGLDYPRDRLDLCLIVEDDDTLTRDALERTALPDWAQVIEVPAGAVRTKPRALNFAMTRARGSIIGIYDAEDTPEPRQLRKVVQRFAERPAEVACLQGQLDYFNPASSWISRCFTLEYATWFRLILPGMERLGLVIPLGGTTLFLRRGAIDEVGGWDAHNVTEDADLGLRLARAGYRTEVIETVTMEEANARLWPWVRQRSRWLKGYAMTYAVHMRQPVRLFRELGAWRFFGVQLLFLGTLSTFVLAPVLWSFWLVLFGLPHPLEGVLAAGTVRLMAALFVAAEVINIALFVTAARRAGRGRLAFWVPMMQVYFPLATLAAYKGIGQMFSRPFYWDKTEHGLHPGPRDVIVTPPPQPSVHPIAAE